MAMRDQEMLVLKIVVISACTEIAEAAKCFREQWRGTNYDKE